MGVSDVSNRRKPAPEWVEAARVLRENQGAIARLYREHAPAFVDQVAAATEDPVHGRLKAVLYGQGFKDRPGLTAPVIDQVGALRLGLLAGLADGTTRHCPHVRLEAPVPVLAVAWARTVDCYPCAGKRARTEPELSEQEKWTCDLCREYREGDCAEQFAQMGPDMLVFGACTPCLENGCQVPGPA